jgi:DNA polymerase-4
LVAEGLVRPGGRRRLVAHVDMDAFFASVEVLDAPRLRGRPVIVGGLGRRGVVASCTYEARAFGVSSAMAMSEARRRCPQGVYIQGRFSRYVEVSRLLRQEAGRFSPVVEFVALDEAYVDLSGCSLGVHSVAELAWSMREAVTRATGIGCSVGVASSKLLAKLASEAAKPIAYLEKPQYSGATDLPVARVVAGRGVVVIDDDEVISFLHAHGVSAIPGVGPATESKLARMGITTVGELAEVPCDALCRVLGNAAGQRLFSLARGLDEGAVVSGRERKSVGHEETFSEDLRSFEEMHGALVRLADALFYRLGELGLVARTVGVKVKLADRSILTRSLTPQEPAGSARELRMLASALLRELHEGESVPAGCLAGGVRLLGLFGTGLMESSRLARQLELFADSDQGGDDRGDALCSAGPGPSSTIARSTDQAPAGLGAGRLRAPRLRRARPFSPPRRGADKTRWEKLDAASRKVRERFGAAALAPASLVRGTSIQVASRGSGQWGPPAPDDLP